MITIIAMLSNLVFRVAEKANVDPELLFKVMNKADDLAKVHKLEDLFPNSGGPENRDNPKY